MVLEPCVIETCISIRAADGSAWSGRLRGESCGALCVTRHTNPRSAQVRSRWASTNKKVWHTHTHTLATAEIPWTDKGCRTNKRHEKAKCSDQNSSHRLRQEFATERWRRTNLQRGKDIQKDNHKYIVLVVLSKTKGKRLHSRNRDRELHFLIEELKVDHSRMCFKMSVLSIYVLFVKRLLSRRDTENERVSHCLLMLFL